MDDTLAFYGGAVKALGGGKIAGYGVLFGGNDAEGERFTKSTDLDLGVGEKRSIHYRHGMHPVIKDRKLGKASLKNIDDEGAFFEGELNLRDNYERYIYKLAEMGKLGWSTGAVSHLVRKEVVMEGDNQINELKSWPIGEISLTPCPAEPRTAAFTVKELGEKDELDALIKSLETPPEPPKPFNLAGLPAIAQFCEDVSPNSVKDGSQRSESAASAAKEFITAGSILGEAFHSYTARLVRRTENRFLKDSREMDAQTVLQVEGLLWDLDGIDTAFNSVKEVLRGLHKISEMSKAEQKAMTEKAKFALWNYYRISGFKPEELEDGTSTGNHN